MRNTIDPIARRLGQAGQRAGLSVREVAEDLGRTRATVESWEAGRTCPRVSDARELCRTLRCSPEWLILGPRYDVETGRVAS